MEKYTPPEIKPSTLDRQMPDGVELVYRLTEARPSGRGRAPRVISDHTSQEAAQAASKELTRQGIPHHALTWWRKNGKHVHKWATIMHGRRRHFKVTVPYVATTSDEEVITKLRFALLFDDDRPNGYTESNVSVRADPDANKLEVDDHAVVVHVNEDCLAAMRARTQEEVTAIIQLAFLEQL